MEADNFYEDDDLVVASGPERNWKGIIIAVLVIASVCALIVTSVVLLTPPDEGPRVKGRRLQLTDIFSQDFQPLHLNGTWVSEFEWIFRDSDGGMSSLDVRNGTPRSLISNHTFRRFFANSFAASSDLKYVLFPHDVHKTHRVSFTAKYSLYHLETGDAKEVSIENPPAPEQFTFQLIKWAPTGQGLALVHNGDIYYKPNPKDRKSTRITFTGQPGVIFNGVPDWLYEEEILGSPSALWFSSDGGSLLFLTFNDTLVGEHHMLEYGPLESPYLYPRIKSLRYPKPGTNNPTVKATLVDLRFSSSRAREITPPEAVGSREHYITAAGWVRSSDVVIVWTLRSYNLSIVSLCPVISGRCEEVYRVSVGRGWVETTQLPLFSKTSKNFLTIAPVRDAENGYFDQIVFVDVENMRSHPITVGNTDVLKINAWDEERKFIYYTAVPPVSPGQRRLFRVRLQQPFAGHSPQCLLCQDNFIVKPSNSTLDGRFIPKTKQKEDPTPPPRKQVGQKQHQEGRGREQRPTKAPMGTGSLIPILTNNQSCPFVTVMKFNSAKTFVILECGGPQVPFVGLYATTKKQENATEEEQAMPKLSLISILQGNEALSGMSGGVAFPQTRTFSVHLNPGYMVQVRLLLPPGLREDEITKYPLLLNVYGGPGTQLALERWNIDFATYLASKKDYIIAQVDSRGSGGRGWNFQHQVYYRLGELEVQDQIQVVRHLRDSLHFVDAKRIGVWGWSFGGYLTAMIMTRKESNNLFHCGASIAPVASWRLYDSAYTERYMGTPNMTDNYKGYADSDVMSNLEPLGTKMFFLAHGTADDNVHFQHSMLLAKALIRNKILFRQQVYPDEPHGLNGAKYHVHKSIERFFEDCFRKQEPHSPGIGLNKGGKYQQDYQED